MDLIAGLALGVQTAVTPEALMFCFFGVTIGMFIGVLPGIGPLAAVAMILPVTYHLEPTTALIMLAGIFYGAQYGGSTASILLNLPGTSTTAVTAIDGYPMAQQGRAGVALFITTITSFFGRLLCDCSFDELCARPWRDGAGILIGGVFLDHAAWPDRSGDHVARQSHQGRRFGGCGADARHGGHGYDVGRDPLHLRLSGIAGRAEPRRHGDGPLSAWPRCSRMSARPERDTSKLQKVRIRDLMPTRDDLRQCWKPAVRGSFIGSFIGVLPGAGPTLAAFLSYAFEKRVAKDPSRFRARRDRGHFRPRSRQQRLDAGRLHPDLALGIPGDAAMAVLLGAMMIHGIQPRPEFFTLHADLFLGPRGQLLDRQCDAAGPQHPADRRLGPHPHHPAPSCCFRR
jgi:putative tricarboxylic transport membrane protein